jgi:WD40 repeat protein
MDSADKYGITADNPTGQSPSAAMGSKPELKCTKLVPKKKVKIHDTYALRCAFSPDSTLLATTSADHTCRLWRTTDYCEYLSCQSICVSSRNGCVTNGTHAGYDQYHQSKRA